jgi:hypothetical protein
MAVTVIVGILNHGDPAITSIYGLVAGLLFGGGALFTGNLLQSYIIDAAIKEAERKALEKELERKLGEEARLDSAQSAAPARQLGRNST